MVAVKRNNTFLQACFRSLSTAEALVRLPVIAVHAQTAKGGMVLTARMGIPAHVRGVPLLKTLLRMLVQLMARLRNGTERAVGRKLGVRVPTLGQLSEWIGLVLESHFSMLVLTPDAHPLLRSLHAVLSDHVNLCRSLASLQGYLNVLAQRSALTSQPESRDYRIEVLHL